MWRDFPNIDQESTAAAAAAWCAGQQDRFWQYHDVLFDYVWENFWSQGVNAERREAYQGHYREFAEQAGVPDDAAFESCLDSGDGQQATDRDHELGRQQGVGGTPTFFVNGRKVVGAQPYSVFTQLIEQELQ